MSWTREKFRVDEESFVEVMFSERRDFSGQGRFLKTRRILRDEEDVRDKDVYHGTRRSFPDE